MPGDRSTSLPTRTPTDDYRALREGAAIAQLIPRGHIAVSGRDRASYLQGLLTNDIQALTPGTGCYAAWLTPQGRMVTDLHVLESGDMILLDVPASTVSVVLQRLDQFLFSEDVQLADLTTTLRDVSIHGPAAAAALDRTISGAGDLSRWTNYGNARATFAGSPVVISRIDQLGVPGFAVYLEPARAADLVSALAAAGVLEAEHDAVEAARIEAGYPLFGVDMDEDTIPLEAGIETRAISFTKGCYVGQEVIIRVLHRGHGRVARRLVGLTVEGEAPSRGSRLFSGERHIGTVTSSAVSPTSGTIALGYVHRDFVEPGTRIEVEAGGSRLVAIVRPRLFA
jgi:folate-binding protein YgfZ